MQTGNNRCVATACITAPGLAFVRCVPIGCRMKPRFLLALACTLQMLLASQETTGSPLHVASTPPAQAAHVLNRLAFGPRPGDIERVEAVGIDRYIEAQLDPTSIPLPESLQRKLDAIDTDRDSAGRTLAAFLDARAVARQGDQDARKATVARITLQTAQARLLRAVESPRQLQEVMVDFWFNHFNIFAGKGLDRALINAYERDAIRPNALGRFRTLLGATAKDPAMLFYLDNWLSTADVRAVGAPAVTSLAGQKTKPSGLNENYARELMELHTLGVDGGYSQADVTTLARMLTGWSFKPRALAQDNAGFNFDSARHDGSAKTWLGRPVTAQGQAEGEYALDILAIHPATARRLSSQLAQYFLQDTPPADLVERMTQRYLASDGDIGSILHVLFFSREFRDPASAGKKFKTPYRYVVSAIRATGAPLVNVRPLVTALNQLGMPLYGCQTPDGYKNTEAAWLSSDALTRRLVFATALAAGRLPLTQAEVQAMSLPVGTDVAAVSSAAATSASLFSVDAPGAMQPDRAIKSSMEKAAVAPAITPTVDPLTLAQTLGPLISVATSASVSKSLASLRAALLLGSPDFMQH